MIKYVLTPEIVKLRSNAMPGQMRDRTWLGQDKTWTWALRYTINQGVWTLTHQSKHTMQLPKASRFFSHDLFIKSTCSYNVLIVIMVIRFPMIKLHSHFWETDHSSVVVIFKSNSNWQTKERLVSKIKLIGINEKCVIIGYFYRIWRRLQKDANRLEPRFIQAFYWSDYLRPS